MSATSVSSAMAAQRTADPWTAEKGRAGGGVQRHRQFPVERGGVDFGSRASRCEGDRCFRPRRLGDRVSEASAMWRGFVIRVVRARRVSRRSAFGGRSAIGMVERIRFAFDFASMWLALLHAWYVFLRGGQGRSVQDLCLAAFARFGVHAITCRRLASASFADVPVVWSRIIVFAVRLRVELRTTATATKILVGGSATRLLPCRASGHILQRSHALRFGVRAGGKPY